ncbi:uncharacterized protein NEMAJ01_1689 [Nematocida major]|uniref:uncharacterized protein n=1 Tax=Nematocida major TaxID=1912982 RepID=UPI0020088EF6|nr:uncharacterized protein NEMAJ01_1689 [Nematocida major]KAH9386793.1 hypothetical protein NEMAJ01_1689 [Nematocida major]
MFDDILEYLKRKPDEAPTRKRSKTEAPLEHPSDSPENGADAAPAPESQAFDLSGFFDEKRRERAEYLERKSQAEKSSISHALEEVSLSLDGPVPAPPATSQDPSSCSLHLEEIELSVVLSQGSIPEAPSPKGGADEHSYLCSQAPISSIEAQLQHIKQRNPSVNYISIGEIKASDALKVSGMICGYVIKHSPVDTAGCITITDGVDSIVCAVCSNVIEAHVLEKDSIVLIESPSVWRLDHVQNRCVLNIVLNNVVTVVKSSVQ